MLVHRQIDITSRSPHTHILHSGVLYVVTLLQCQQIICRGFFFSFPLWLQPTNGDKKKKQKKTTRRGNERLRV